MLSEGEWMRKILSSNNKRSGIKKKEIMIDIANNFFENQTTMKRKKVKGSYRNKTERMNY